LSFVSNALIRTFVGEGLDLLQLKRCNSQLSRNRGIRPEAGITAKVADIGFPSWRSECRKRLSGFETFDIHGSFLSREKFQPCGDASIP
jgi:hypothetical protein